VLLRLTAAFAALLGALLFTAYLGVVGKGPLADAAERHIRARKDRVAVPADVARTTFAALAALPRSRPVAEYAALEDQAVSLEGYVQRMVRAPDGDIHLDFAPESGGPDGPLVPYVSGEITPQWHLGSRAWSYGNLVREFRPNFGGVTAWDAGAARVRLSGWRLYDFEYEGAPPQFGFPSRLSNWEIHPVTRIEVWNDSAAAFVEVPR
jgi:hypothetical protein